MTRSGAPESFAEALRAIAAWLDTGDKATKLVMHAKGIPQEDIEAIVGSEVQEDLRAMADRLDETLVVGPTLDDMWKDIINSER